MSIKIYVAVRMTGRYCDEVRQESDMLVRVLQNYGLEPLSPVIEENIPYVHELLHANDQATLERYWKRDKEMLRESDIMLDYMSCNTSDGVGKELGYTRYCLWKPTIRVYPGLRCAISKLEDDAVVESLNEAIDVITRRFGSYEKLRMWRQAMWDRSFISWLTEQLDMNSRYGAKPESISWQEI